MAEPRTNRMAASRGLCDLTGKRAVVTGGSRGIGAATARLLARCGADVAISYRTRATDAERLVESLAPFGVRTLARATELADAAAVDAFFAAVAATWGGVDIFVGNAGIWPADEAAVAAMPDERWRRTMAENVDGMFHSTRAALRHMGGAGGPGTTGETGDPGGADATAFGGRIVLVSSTAGQRGEAMHADYAASKGAMISFVKSLAIEVAARGITVNSVAPGWVETEMCEQPFAHGGRERIARAIPVGRIATPEDIAAPIVFLCSAEARHITGEILNVNGGSVLCG